MAVIGQTVTLQDLAKRLDPSGKIDKIVEALNQTNEILDDMTWQEGNLTTGHKTTIRNGLPTVAWRLLNYGVPSSKSTTTQITDTCGMLEAYAEIDKELADLNGNTAEFRTSEDLPFLEAMNQALVDTIIYGDTSQNPERFVGLAPRFSTVNVANAASAANVLDAGGTGSTNTSIWLVCWGDATAFGIIPKGSQAGFKHQDLGEVTLLDANNNKYQGYRSHYQWKCGLTVRDWRYIVRIANIDVMALTKNASAGADLIDLLQQAIELLPNQNMGKPVFYANRVIRSFLRRQIVAKTAYNLTLDTVMGRKVIQMDDIPFRRVDRISNTEARVV